MKKTHLLLMGFVLLSFLLSGCYYFSAKREMKDAEKLILELKAAGGEKLAPYEYCSAGSNFGISQVEFYNNDFKGAQKFAEQSKSAAESGLTQVKKK
ncbi:MAG: hypothetical protein HXY46_12885 [Syntrophaceae bacterium]|nr:hypothetical protein [Syntrophaceae bacterium]